MGVVVQQVPNKERVTTTFISDRYGLFSAEVPFGPIRASKVLTEVIACPLHWSPSAPVNPTAKATNAKSHVNITGTIVAKNGCGNFFIEKHTE